MRLENQSVTSGKIEIFFDRNKIRDHFEQHGIEEQLGILQEEMAELIKDISKYRRGKCEYTDLAEELADVFRVWIQAYSIMPNTVDYSFNIKEDIFK